MKSTTMNNIPTNWKSRATQNGPFHTVPKNWIPDDYLHTKITFTLLTRNGPFHTFPRVGSVTTLFTHALLLSRSLSLSLAVDRFPDAQADAHTRSEIEILWLVFSDLMMFHDHLDWSFGGLCKVSFCCCCCISWVVIFVVGVEFCLGLLLASLLPWFWKLDRSLTRSRSGVLFWLWI
jgi:hypothetical protein